MGTTLLTSQYVNDITSNPCDVFVATDGGVDVIDKNDLSNKGYINFPEPVTSVFHRADRCNSLLYVGTATSGVHVLSTSSVTLTGNLSSYLAQYYVAPVGISSDQEQVIAGNNQGDLAVATLSGLDFHRSTSSVKASTQISGGMSAVCVTEAGAIYYSPIEGGGLYAKYEPVSSGWSVADYLLTENGLDPIPSNVINDIQINTHSGTNHIFLATNSGLFIYEENRSDISGSISGAKYFQHIP